MPAAATGLVTLSDITLARDYVSRSGLVRRTPLLSGFQFNAGGTKLEIGLKLESLQHTGSFKIRGMTNCFRVHEQEIREKGAVTLSADLSRFSVGDLM